MEQLWAKIAEFLLTQGWAGIILLLMAIVIWDQRKDIKDLRTRNSSLQDLRVTDAQTFDRTDTDRNRNKPGGDPGIYRSDPAPQGVILGRLYRLIFGGSRYTKNHDAEVQAAQQRVNKALEGLDRDVLLLMKATMLDGFD